MAHSGVWGEKRNTISGVNWLRVLSLSICHLTLLFLEMCLSIRFLLDLMALPA